MRLLSRLLGRPTRTMGRLRAALALSALSGVLVACNAIVGVEDVTLRERTDPGTADKDAGDDPVTDADVPDTERPVADRGQLALGYNHGCARLPDGTVRCWGDNGAGQVGDGVPFDGSREDVLTPQDVPGITDAVAIASGLSHTCVVHEGGSVSCWGSNLFGQLGDGLKESRPTAAPVKSLEGVVSIAAATDHACAVLENGDVMCWGGNSQGQLGIGSTTESLSPTKLNALSDIAQVAAAARFSCARQTSGRVYCWGNNQYGQLGNGSPNTAPNPSPILVPSIGDAVFLWTGNEHACAVRKDGEIACWGSAGQGQLGKGSVPADASIATPVAVVGAPPAIGVWTGGNRSCSLAADGRAFCWGQNSTGQLGNGTTEIAYAAVPVSNLP